jgi:RNA polymerase sigma-70 factor
MLVAEKLDQAMAGGYAEGRARFGELGLEMKVYADRIAMVIRKNLGETATDDEIAAFTTKLHLRDFYLATACAKDSLGFGSKTGGDEAMPYSSIAWQTLEREYKPFIRRVARFFARQPQVAHDLAESILADLFLPDGAGQSRILSYDGRSSLCTWIRVVIANRAINLRRGAGPSQLEDIEAGMWERLDPANIDRIIRARRYGDRFADAMKYALRQLSSQDRLLLLWRYEDGLQLGQIAKLLDLHQSNVTRRLRRLHAKLKERIIAGLSTRHALGKPAIEECLQGVTESVTPVVSILDCLATCEAEQLLLGDNSWPISEGTTDRITRLPRDRTSVEFAVLRKL